MTKKLTPRQKFTRSIERVRLLHKKRTWFYDDRVRDAIVKNMRDAIEKSKNRLDEMSRKKMIPEPNSQTKVLNSRELIDTIGKSRAKAVFKHPWYRKHFDSHELMGYPVGHKVDVDKQGFPTVSVSSNWKFKTSKGETRRMIQFPLSRHTPKVYNAHLFHNYDDQRHHSEFGGGPMWHYISSQHDNDKD